MECLYGYINRTFIAVFYCFLTAEYILPLPRGLDVGCACATYVRVRQMYVRAFAASPPCPDDVAVRLRGGDTRGFLLTRRLGYIP